MDNTCTVSCIEGYDVRHGEPTEFTCGDGGWQPTNSVPQCQGRNNKLVNFPKRIFREEYENEYTALFQYRILLN